MALKEFRRPDWPKPYTEKTSHKYRSHESDPLFDRDWEVFVVQRDVVSGELKTLTARSEEDLDDARPRITNQLGFC